jgi:hypothetical protein
MHLYLEHIWTQVGCMTCCPSHLEGTAAASKALLLPAQLLALFALLGLSQPPPTAERRTFDAALAASGTLAASATTGILCAALLVVLPGGVTTDCLNAAATNLGATLPAGTWAPAFADDHLKTGPALLLLLLPLL